MYWSITIAFVLRVQRKWENSVFNIDREGEPVCFTFVKHSSTWKFRKSPSSNVIMYENQL